MKDILTQKKESGHHEMYLLSKALPCRNLDGDLVGLWLISLTSYRALVEKTRAVLPRGPI